MKRSRPPSGSSSSWDWDQALPSEAPKEEVKDETRSEASLPPMQGSVAAQVMAHSKKKARPGILSSSNSWKKQAYVSMVFGDSTDVYFQALILGLTLARVSNKRRILFCEHCCVEEGWGALLETVWEVRVKNMEEKWGFGGHFGRLDRVWLKLHVWLWAAEEGVDVGLWVDTDVLIRQNIDDCFGLIQSPHQELAALWRGPSTWSLTKQRDPKTIRAPGAAQGGGINSGVFVFKPSVARHKDLMIVLQEKGPLYNEARKKGGAEQDFISWYFSWLCPRCSKNTWGRQYCYYCKVKVSQIQQQTVVSLDMRNNFQLHQMAITGMLWDPKSDNGMHALIENPSTIAVYHFSAYPKVTTVMLSHIDWSLEKEQNWQVTRLMDALDKAQGKDWVEAYGNWAFEKGNAILKEDPELQRQGQRADQCRALFVNMIKEFKDTWDSYLFPGLWMHIFKSLGWDWKSPTPMSRCPLCGSENPSTEIQERPLHHLMLNCLAIRHIPNEAFGMHGTRVGPTDKMKGCFTDWSENIYAMSCQPTSARHGYFLVTKIAYLNEYLKVITREGFKIEFKADQLFKTDMEMKKAWDKQWREEQKLTTNELKTKKRRLL